MSKLLIIDRGSTPDLFIKSDVTPDQEAAIEYYLSGGHALPSPTPSLQHGKVVSAAGVVLHALDNTSQGGVWSGAVVTITGKTIDGQWYIMQGLVTANPDLVQIVS